MRNIFTVNATQIITSEQNPQGLLSNVSGFPVAFDSRSYNAQENPNGDEGVALAAAKEKFNAEIVALSTANNATRVGWVVSIIRASDGREMERFHWGGFPDMTPQPEPEPEEVEGE